MVVMLAGAPSPVVEEALTRHVFPVVAQSPAGMIAG
jgi:hypothetical protein